MKIKSMEVSNFLSFGKARFDLADQGLVLVEGENQDDESARSNGSGKSAMIDALVWCLFGTTLRGYEGDDVIHRKVGEDCLVVVELEDDHGDEYTVSRARRHKLFKNAVAVFGDADQDLSKGSNQETQEVIEKLLGCSKRTFMSSVVFGQDRAYRFSSLTDKEQKEILDEVLGMDRFAYAYSAARQLRSMFDAEVDKAKHDLERVTDVIEDVERELKDAKRRDAEFTETHDADVAALQAKIDKTRKQIEDADVVDTKKLRSKLEKLAKAIESSEKTLDTANKADADARYAIGIAAAKVDELVEYIERHQKLSGTCPTCSQEVTKKSKAAVLAEYQKQLAVAKKRLADLKEKADAVSDSQFKAKKAFREAGAARDDATAAITKAEQTAAEVDFLKRRLADHLQSMDKLSTTSNPFAALIERMTKKLEKHRKEKELLEAQLLDVEKKHKTYSFWVDGFGARGLRSLLLDGALPLLNNEAAKISRAVTGGAIDVEFSATSELKSGKTVDKFEVKVDNKHGAGTYKGNSAGERAKVDLCVGLALQKLVASRSSASFNVVFMDEVFDHLDAAAHERVVEVLSEIDKESVFVVSHDDDLKAWFPSTIRITKQDGFSTVTEQ